MFASSLPISELFRNYFLNTICFGISGRELHFIATFEVFLMLKSTILHLINSLGEKQHLYRSPQKYNKNTRKQAQHHFREIERTLGVLASTTFTVHILGISEITNE